MFKIGDYAILNEKVQSGLPSHVGELVTIYATANHSPNYDFTIMLENGDLNPVKESELNVLTERQKELITYLRKNNEVTYIPTGEIVRILKVDYLYGQVEIEHEDKSQQVVLYTTLKQLEDEIWRIVEQPEEESSGKFTEIALEIGEFTDMKNKQYGSSVDATQKMIEVLMERYTYDEENYLMPKSLLKHILLQVRMMDKQNRIFNNPSGEGDSESPYRDLGGYSLIGIEMTEK